MTTNKDKAVVEVKEHGTTPTLQVPILNPLNYNIWAVRIQAVFRVHKILEAIDITNDNVADESKDHMAIALLLQAIPEELVLQVAHLTTAKEIWRALKNRFIGVERVRDARLQTLESEFENLRMRQDESIDDYASKISKLVAKANSLGATYQDEKLVKKLLGSVPDRFIAIIAAIEQFADLKTMTFQESVGRLKAFEERTKHVHSSTGNDKLMFSSYNGRKPESSQAAYKGSKGGERRWVLVRVRIML
jgi:hypothetical protein